MVVSKNKEHPAAIYNKARHHLFSIYEKTRDFDKSISILKRYPLIKPSKHGLKAELLFYDRFYRELKLEPLLDAGVKADFSGIRKKKMVNFDVTTNLDYKDINKYANVVQRRKKEYELVLIDLKKEDIEFFPLKFPICPDCGLFAHFILFMSRPSRDITFCFSTSQGLIRHCTSCYEFEIVEEFDYQIESILMLMEEIAERQANEETRDPNLNFDEFMKKEVVSTVQFFEGTSRKMMSGLAEGDYIITDPRNANGFYGGRMIWTHPLAEPYLDDVIAYDYYNGFYVS